MNTTYCARLYDDAGTITADTMMTGDIVWVPLRTYASLDIGIGNMIASGWNVVTRDDKGAGINEYYFTTDRPAPP